MDAPEIPITKADYLTREEERRLARLASAGDQAARERLWRSQARYAAQLAHRFAANFGVESDEAVAEAWCHLLHLVDRFDPQKNCRLSTLVGSAIGRHLLRWRNGCRLVALPSNATNWVAKYADKIAAAQRPAAPIDELDWSEDRPTPAHIAEQEEELDRLGAAIERLDPRERQVVQRRMKGDRLYEIGADLGVSKERVRQIEKQAHSRLRKELTAA